MKKLVALALALAGLGAPAAHAATADPVDVLVYTATYGFRHGSIDAAKKQFQALGATEEFDVAMTEKASDLNARFLRNFDVLVFVNATGNQPFSADQKQEMLDWLATGKGIVATHAAVDANYTWSDYGDIIGAYFHSHPHTGLATNVVEDRTSPFTAHLPERFEIEEEYYRLQLDPRENVHVLASLDRASAGNNGATYVESQPTMWCQQVGGGRAFTTLWGHFDETYVNPAVWTSIQQALRWAGGRIDADCSVKPQPGRVQAEAADVIAGSEKEASPFDGANQVVTRIQHDGYVLFRDLDLTDVKTVKVSAAPETAPTPNPYQLPQSAPALGGTVSVVLDDLGYDNQALGGSGPTYKVAGSAELRPGAPPSTMLDGATGGDPFSWGELEIPIEGASGRHDVYLVFTSAAVATFNPARVFAPVLQESMYLGSVDWIEFPGLRARPAAPTAPRPRGAAPAKLFKGVRSLPRSLKASRSGRVTLRFPRGAFPAGTSLTGQITGSPSTLASGRATVGRGAAKVTLRLSARARRALSRARRFRGRLTVTAAAPDGTSARRNRTVTIRR